ncbi:MAG: DEAD/DEAH box helicase [Anaerolineaceae bacterium]|nr:DEAD/DEAH box helicase [Anaerolineaceae bacterium]
MSLSFEKMGLQLELLDAINNLKFNEPTPIQLEAIPSLLAGKNVLGQAQTGTGKTAAFALPMLQQIDPEDRHIQALVLAPTRELAVQVAKATQQMAGNSHVRILPVYGGQSYTIQKKELKRGVEIVVGTPGRMLDLINQGVLDLSHVRYVVLDEADVMLEMGFIDDVDTILAEAPVDRQMALFSATMPRAIRKLADKHMRDIHEIKISPRQVTVAETEQRHYILREENKKDALIRLLEIEAVTSALIFSRTKIRTQELADTLNAMGYKVDALHGDLNQSRREYVMNRFRKGINNILIATDVAARGLDIENVSHVINFDAPADAEDYVHRIGRTGRAGRKGIAITFVTPNERGRFLRIESYIHQSINVANIPTKQQILDYREKQFITRLTDLLGKGNIDAERSIITKLEETSFSMIDITAAAIKLARETENHVVIEEFAEHQSPRKRNSNKKSFSGGKPGSKYNRNNGSESKRSKKSSQRRKGSDELETGMVRLRMNLGNSHGIRPGDVVGAIAGEVGIPGRAIGEINIQNDHTYIDVAEQHASNVLKASTGKYSLRGKPVMLTKDK